MATPICITGMGLCSAIGNGIQAFTENLRSGTSGIREQTDIFAGHVVWAGLVSDSLLPVAAKNVDRSAILAWQAAKNAWTEAFSVPVHVPDSSRIALILGTSHGGRSQIDYCLENVDTFDSSEAAARILKVSPHFQQTEWVGRMLGVNGAVTTVSTACSSSSAAILHGIDLLTTGKADYVLAGGMDGFSKLTHAGFRALGAVANGACGPFSERVGISLGEGSAVVVLERLEHAQAREAQICAQIYGGGSSWDCYHATEPHPSGEGLLRALEMAAELGAIAPERNLDYAGLHGTGTRANDSAETIALQRFFTSGVPPASSVKSLTGHTLGAAGAVGLIAAIVGMREGFLPPTVNFSGPRAGCDLDYVPNQSRAASIKSFSTQSAGFGGANSVLIGGPVRKPRASAVSQSAPPSIVISGMGVVSSAGIGLKAFRDSLASGQSGIAPIERFDVSECATREAGLVRDFHPRKLAPTLNLRRAGLCFQFAAIAVSEALANSQVTARGVANERIGLLVGTTRGAVTSFESCMRSAMGGAWNATSALHFPNLVMSSLGGYVSTLFQLKGSASTVVCGEGGGLQPVIHAMEMLRCNPTQDAIVVVLTDELSPLFYSFFDRMGGTTLGEGAAAFVLERHSAVSQTGNELHLCGYGLTFDAEPQANRQANGSPWFAKSIKDALCDARLDSSAIELIYTHGTGCNCCDARELSALGRILDRSVPLCCVLPNTGFAESASGGFSLVAAGLSLHRQEVYPVIRQSTSGADSNFVEACSPAATRFGNVLLTSSTKSGSNAALIVSASEADQRAGAVH